MLALLLTMGLAEFYIEVLYGVYGTAPFSPWSMLTYLNRGMGLMMVLPLHWAARNSVPQMRLLQTVTSAAPVPASRQEAVKAGVGITGFAFLYGAALLLLFGCYFLMFDSVPLNGLVGISLLFVVPTVLFGYGVALWLGWVNPILIYMLMAVFLSMTLLELRLPMAVDFLGTSILKLGETGTLVNGAISFQPPVVYLISRTGFALLGFLLILLDCRQQAQKA